MNPLEKLLDIYNKIDETQIHKKWTSEKSIKLATIINRIFYYLEYSNVLIREENIHNFNYYRYNIVVSIGRNVMELFNIYEYFGEKGISMDEYQLRQECANYHQQLTKEQLDKRLKDYNEKKFNQMNSIVPASNYLRRIKSNLVYKNSDKKWQQSLVSARKCYYFARVENKLNILPAKLEPILYNMFSNYTHSFELALGFDFFRGNNEMYSGYYQAQLAIYIIELYSSIALKDYISRRNLKSKISKEDYNFLTSLISYKKIEDTLIKWKNKYDFNNLFSTI